MTKLEKKYDWDEIYERADGAACGEPTLKAKDEARWQVGRLMVRNGEPDPENDEIPEESIEDYCDRYGIRFDDRGNIDINLIRKTVESAVNAVLQGER